MQQGNTKLKKIQLEKQLYVRENIYLKCRKPKTHRLQSSETIKCTNKCMGKNLVFTMTIKRIPEFWRNQDIPEKFWKTYDQVKLDLFQDFYLFLILFLVPEFCHPQPGPTTLQSYLTYYV